jgi:hypothetical protein
MASVGRNERCPCGSGRRYKECHGAIGAAGASAAEVADPAHALPLPQLMQAALRAQRSSDAIEAAALYRRVLDADPSNFDATHMLGLVEYESGRYETAVTLLRRATELRPDLGTPRHNLRVVESMPAVEREICRDVLPRLVDRVEPVLDLITLASSAAVVHLVIAGAVPSQGKAALVRLAAALAATRLTVWAKPGASPGIPYSRTLDIAAGSHPEGGLLVLYGTAESPATWLGAARAGKVVLVVADDDPCAVIDRIDELCGLHEERPGLICASRALAERLRLPPKAVVPEPEPAPLSSP